VVKDVTQHRAAAVALANLRRFRYLDDSKAYAEAEDKVLNSTERATLEALAERVGIELSLLRVPKTWPRASPLRAG
jgi:hypothetical protein